MCIRDRNDAAFLHKGQERILLSLIEPMDLIHKYDGLFPITAVFLRLLHDRADLLNTAGNRRKIYKRSFCPVSNDSRESCLAHTGRPPENHGRYLVAFNQASQHLTLAQQVCQMCIRDSI